MIKYAQLISDLKRGNILPVYLFSGEEEFLVQEAVDLIIARTVDPGTRDFNFSAVYCRETAAADLVNLCQTFPFMSERRLVIARDIDAYKTSDQEELAGYLRDPAPSTCLVMISGQRKFDRKAVVAAAEAAGAVTVMYPLLDREVPGWIEGRARGRGLSIGPDAAQYLWQSVGSDLRKIINELEKVALFIKERKAITLDDVRAVAGDFREYTAFDLAAALGLKDRERSFLILARLIQEGEQPVGILGSIAWNFQRLLRAKALEAAGTGYDDIKRTVGVIFHQSAAFQQQMRRFSMAELRSAIGILLSTDLALKTTSGLSGRLILERLILRVCGVEER